MKKFIKRMVLVLSLPIIGLAWSSDPTGMGLLVNPWSYNPFNPAHQAIINGAREQEEKERAKRRERANRPTCKECKLPSGKCYKQRHGECRHCRNCK